MSTIDEKLMSSKIGQKLNSMDIKFDQEEFVVIDNGTGFIKAGFSGQDLPRIVMPTVIGEKTEIVDNGVGNIQLHGEQQYKQSWKFGNQAYQRKDEF